MFFFVFSVCILRSQALVCTTRAPFTCFSTISSESDHIALLVINIRPISGPRECDLMKFRHDKPTCLSPPLTLRRDWATLKQNNLFYPSIYITHASPKKIRNRLLSNLRNRQLDSLLVRLKNLTNRKSSCLLRRFESSQFRIFLGEACVIILPGGRELIRITLR